MREALIEFFRANMMVVLFGYGLSFFAMGLAIALQSRRPSELRMARQLPLLGVFGILQALASWGLVFIPIHRIYTPGPVILGLQVLYALLTALTFAFLLAFGAQLVADSLPRLWPVRYLPEALTGLWSVGFLIYPLLVEPNRFETWVSVSDTWARYILGLPGSALVALALALQVEELKARGMDRLIPQLRWAIFWFGAYAVAAGLVVPPAGFFPSTYLNSEAFLQVTGIPVELLRGVAGLGMAYFMIRLLEMFDIEAARRMEEVQRMRAVLSERDRIARELHDGVIQSLYALGLGIESAAYAAEHNPAQTRPTLKELMGRVNGIIQDVRSYIMDLRLPGEVSLPLSEKLQAVVREASRVYHVPITLEVRGIDEGRIAGLVANELSLVVKEALSNAARHGQPGTIRVGVHREEDELVLYVQDDGKGFAPEAAAQAGGLGLSNMRKRAVLLGGELDVDSCPGEGTTVVLRMPLQAAAEASSPAGTDARPAPWLPQPGMPGGPPSAGLGA